MTVKRQKTRLRFCKVFNIRNQFGTVVKSPFLDKMCTPMSTVSGPAGCLCEALRCFEMVLHCWLHGSFVKRLSFWLLFWSRSGLHHWWVRYERNKMQLRSQHESQDFREGIESPTSTGVEYILMYSCTCIYYIYIYTHILFWICMCMAQKNLLWYNINNIVYWLNENT